MLSYILHSPDLHQKIQEEVVPHVQNSMSLSEILPKLLASKWLVATYQETLRVAISSTSVRHVSETCVIGNKTLQKDAQVIIPYRQMLMDDRVFGADADTFNPARFISSPGFANDASYRPFGGGITYCPGRHIASKEALLTVSLLVGQYRLERRDPNLAFPGMNTITPCVGVMALVKGADIHLVVEERS
jgi:cytochrome P450